MPSARRGPIELVRRHRAFVPNDVERKTLEALVPVGQLEAEAAP